MTDPRELPLMIASDDGYLFASAVTVRSISALLDPTTKLHVFAYLEGANDADRFAQYCRDIGAEITVVRDEDLSARAVASIDRVQQMNPRLPRAINARYAIPELLKGRFKQAVYTDVDVAAVQDISALWDCDLGEWPVGAITAASDIGTQLPQAQRYFNSGVLLIDIDRWLSEDIGQRILTAMMENPAWAIFDQHAANAVLMDEVGAPLWQELSPVWNAMTPFFGRRLDRLVVPPLKHEDARLVHFAGGLRRESLERHPFGSAFLNRLAEVPFEPTEGFLRRTPLRTRLIRQARERLSDLRR